jgi:peptide/nickel transport system substrate-binding protein
MSKIKPVVALLLLALIVPALAMRPASAQDEAGMIDRLDFGDFGGGSNPQSNFNPYSFNALTGGTTWLFEPLMMVNAYSCEVVPWLASEFNWTDPQTLNFTIRDGVVWSDGTGFSAEDVVFTFKMTQQFPALDTDGLWNFLTDVTASGNVVTFTFKEPSGSLFNKLVDNPIVPRHIWVDVEDPVTFTNDTPVGTGPFVLASFNRQELVMEKNPTYWQAEKIRVQQLVYTKVEGEGQINQLRLAEGRYDWAEMFMPDVQNSFVAKDPENNHFWFPPGGSVSLMMNHTKPPFDDVEFRRGIAHAIDREGIAARAAFGYTPPASQTGLTLPNQQIYLDPAIPNSGFLPYDPEQAKQILTAAGYTYDGDTLIGKDGEPVRFTFLVQTGWNDWVQAAEIVRENMSAIGIEVEVEQMNPDLISNDRKAGLFDATFDAPGGGCNMFDNFYYPLGNSDAPTPVDTPTENNWIRWNDPETAQILQGLRAATTIEEQQPLMYQMNQIMYNELPFIPLWYGPVWFEYQTDKAEGWPNAENPYAHPGNKLLIITNLVPAA